MRILRRVLESVAAHARESFPHESCGILLAGIEDPSTVRWSLRAENAENVHPERAYVLGHKAHIRAVKMEFSGTARIVGYYHSHPDGEARPSQNDVNQAVAGVTYLIVGIRNGDIERAAWKLRGDRLVQEPLEVRE